MQTRRQLLRQGTIIGAAAWPGWARAPRLVFACAANNGLYRALTAGAGALPRYESPAEAVAKSPHGAGVLLLANSYPTETTPLDEALCAAAARKGLRLYIEFPSWLPALETGPPRHATLERVVVASQIFGPALDRLRILAIHDCHFVPVKAAQSDLVLARVAGFDTAVYGLPEEAAYPILFVHPGDGILVATTRLSSFIESRYGPADAWTPIWNRIFAWLGSATASSKMKWTPTVRPSFGRGENLPADVESQAFRRGSSWYSRAGLLMPAASADEGLGGVLEGFISAIHTDGTQPLRKNSRNDCAGETSLAMALAGSIGQRTEDRRIAGNLNDYIYFRSEFAQGPRADPKSPSFGLLSWTYPDGLGVYYGDDNARSMLGTMGAAASLNSDRWDRLLLRCLLANLRTTGKLGFRGNRIDEPQLQKNSWRHYFDRENVNYAPHYEAYPWACFLWAFDKTRYAPFFERSLNAIRMTVAAYPREWRWTNGMQQERARMLLPLAWLIRVEDKPEYRDWLRKIAQEMLAFQDPCGAIREEIGLAGKGSYAPPKSNAAYGTAEAPLIQANGDPLCDLLYTSNFAFLGLHEAAAATGERLYADAEEKLAKFLCRIQIRSDVHPELDGGWYRAFEFRRWEYWGSNADLGWGVWSIETGWTQAWIASVLGMRHLKTSLWDLTRTSRIREHLDEYVPLMFG